MHRAVIVAFLVSCGGHSGGLSADECARWARLWVYGPGDEPRERIAAQAEQVARMDRVCRDGQVSRAEYECAIRAKDEAQFAACGDPAHAPPASK